MDLSEMGYLALLQKLERFKNFNCMQDINNFNSFCNEYTLQTQYQEFQRQQSQQLCQTFTNLENVSLPYENSNFKPQPLEFHIDNHEELLEFEPPRKKIKTEFIY